MTNQEKADQLARTVNVGDEFISGRDRMRITQVSPTGCTLGISERYTWQEFQRYILVKAITPIQKPDR